TRPSAAEFGAPDRTESRRSPRSRRKRALWGRRERWLAGGPPRISPGRTNCRGQGSCVRGPSLVSMDLALFLITLASWTSHRADVLLHDRRRPPRGAPGPGLHGMGLRASPEDGLLRRREPRVRPSEHVRDRGRWLRAQEDLRRGLHAADLRSDRRVRGLRRGEVL